jgi:hypothetical protein
MMLTIELGRAVLAAQSDPEFAQVMLAQERR